MMIGVVRWTVAAFMANPDADVDELIEMLASIGLPNAERAVAFVPLAFGRQILHGIVGCSDTYVDGNDELALSDEPIFVAALQLARDASRGQLERIGFTSSEVHAVNSALHHGSKPEDLVMSSPHMRLPARSTADLPEEQALVDALLSAHGANLTVETRVFPQRVRKGEATMQIDVVTRDAGREILESFAGIAPTIIDAQKQALHKFAGSTLHVLVAALAGRELCRDHVTWETWQDFDVCSGPLLRQWSTEPALDHGPLFDAILAALPALSRELHWFRLFVAVGDAKLLGFDAMLDNVTYQPVVELVQSWPWPVSDKPYALRHFFVLLPRDA